MMPLGEALGAQFEISVDGKPRSYRDRKAVAIEAAEYLKWKHPHSDCRGDGPREREGDGGGVQVGGGAALKDRTCRSFFRLRARPAHLVLNNVCSSLGVSVGFTAAHPTTKKKPRSRAGAHNKSEERAAQNTEE
jgi:hypothetical protein